MKRLMYFAAVLAIAVGCTGNELTAPVKAKYTLNAEFAPETKTSIDDEGAMMWQANDKISVMDENLGNEAFELITKADTKLGQFQAVDASYEGTPVVAVYPYNDNNYSDGEQVVIKLPAQYEYDGTTSHAPMLATVVNDGLATGTARFSHIAGLIKVTYENVPKSATSFELVATTGIVGEFEVNISDPVINASSASSYGSSVSYEFENTEDNTDMVFYIPVPCGEYGFRVALYDAELNKIAGTGKKVSSVTIEKGDYFVMPTITLESSETDPVVGDWAKTSIENIGAYDQVVITMKKEDVVYALSLVDTDGNALGTSKAPNATPVTVVSDKLSSEPDATIIWNIANDNGALTITPAGDPSQWLYSTNANNGVRLGTNTSNGYVWNINEETGYLGTQTAESTYRIMGVYSGATTNDFRAYTYTEGGSVSSNIEGQELAFYVKPGQKVDVTGVSLDKSSVEIEAGKTETLVATVAPEDASNKNVTWSSSDTNVATVANGVVTAVAAGTSTITVKTVDGEFTATCEVTVTGASYSTIAQVFTGGVGSYSIKDAVVMAKSLGNVILNDGTASIMLYESNNTLEVGQVLTLNNQAVTERNGLLQFSAPTYTVAADKVTPVYGEPVEILTDSDVTSWGGDPQYQYIHFVGIMGTDNKTIKCNEKGIYIAATEGYSGKKVSVYGYANGSVTSYGTITTTLLSIEEVVATTYTITVASDIENGTVTVNPTSAVAGAQVVLTVTPDSGYRTKSVSVKDASNADITVTNNKFTMPESNVTVSAEFELIPEVDGTVDVINLAFTGVSGGTYADFSGKTGTSGAVYAGQCAGGNSAIQLRSKNSNSGVVSTTSGGKVAKIVVEWNSNTVSGRVLNVYGSNTAYTAVTELFDSSKQGTLLGTIVCGSSTAIVVEGDYEYVGLRSAENAMYIDSISITWVE